MHIGLESVLNCFLSKSFSLLPSFHNYHRYDVRKMKKIKSHNRNILGDHKHGETIYIRTKFITKSEKVSVRRTIILKL